MLLISFLLVLIGLPKWLVIAMVISLTLVAWYTGCDSTILCSFLADTSISYRAYREAREGSMVKLKWPVVGELADRWVSDE